MVQTIIKHDKPMTLKEMQDAVNGTIQLVFDDGDTQIICNEEGKLMNLPENERATDIWWDLLDKTEDAHILSNYDVLVGDVLILKGKARMN
jgi:hypothetical protein